MSTLEDDFYLSSMTKITHTHNLDEVKEVIGIASDVLAETESATVYLGNYDDYDRNLTRLTGKSTSMDVTVVAIVLEIPYTAGMRDGTRDSVATHLRAMADKVISEDADRKHAADVAEAERQLAEAYAAVDAAKNRIEALNN